MKKRFTKIICVAVAAISAAGIAAASGCSKYYKGSKLGGDYSKGEVAAEDNGGFVVSKGDWVYFINGMESYEADNSFGKPVKGGIYRISAENLANHNYSTVDCVVPHVIYSGNSNAGIFVYGDYVYYSTPSTEKDANGSVQNSVLELKRTKLNGEETPKEPYVSLATNTDEYRFVQENDSVYILYTATNEKLYDESTGVKNLHSYSISSGKDTLLAYNVDNVAFDSTQKGNPRVYYTMKVRDYVNDSDYSYNQIYTVTASATEDKFKDKLNKDTVLGWDKDTDRYINCGTLVYDGRGKTDVKTAFNADYSGEITRSGYTYTLGSYNSGNLYYTRTSPDNSNPYLYAVKDTATVDPVDGNPASDKRILSYSSSDGAKASGYTYIYNNDGTLKSVIETGSDGINVNRATYTGDTFTLESKKSTTETDAKYFSIAGSDAANATVIAVEGDYLYYTVDSEIYRIDYTGEMSDYAVNVLATDESIEPVKILDLKSQSGWYSPELVHGQILFASATNQMSAYSYIMACDISGLDDKKLEELNELYEGIEKTITETFGDTDKYPSDTYANLTNALRYAFYTGEDKSVYLGDLAERLNAKLEKDENPVYSDRTLALYDAFLKPAADNAWADYAEKTKTVNGETVYANRLAYYYSVVGKMADGDAKSYANALKTSYLVAETVESKTWWQGLSTAAKVWFIIGVVAGSLVVIGGITVLVILLVRKKRKNPASASRKRIKVDLTDDKDIDVYDSGEKPADEEKPE